MSDWFSSQTEEYSKTANPRELAYRIKNMQYDEISFSGGYKSCCVGIVDAVDSTNITANLANGKLCKYYSIFLNAMAVIAKEFGAIVVKNVGDSLLYYFPKTSNGSSKSAFMDTLECNMIMIESHTIINEKMHEENLPPVDYRISSDFGNVMIAKSNSSNDDIFGSTVNLCAKINSKAKPNGIAIGSDLHQIVKNINGYDFNRISAYSSGLKLEYPVYSMTRGKSRKWL